jgi:hypothetical protein
MEKINFTGEPERVGKMLNIYDCFFATSEESERVITALKDNKSFTDIEIILDSEGSPVDWRFWDTYRLLEISDINRCFDGWTNWQNEGGDSVYSESEQAEIETLR